MKSIGTGRHKQVLWFATALAPTVMVQVVQVMSGTGATASASAGATSPYADAPVETPDGDQPIKPATGVQLDALKFIQRNPLSVTMKSPMDEPPPPPPPPTLSQPSANGEQPLSTTPAKSDEPSVDPEPQLRITAIVGSKSGAVAAVGHRLVRVGEPVAPGWKVTDIDAVGRTIRIQHTDGREATYGPSSGDGE